MTFKELSEGSTNYYKGGLRVELQNVYLRKDYKVYG
jgi:hypothetical protein